MKIEVGKSYRTRSGHQATVTIGDESEYFSWGGIIHTRKDDVVGETWTHSGACYGATKESKDDLIAEWAEPYTCWMIQAAALDAIPVPNEEIARAWAKKTEGGRAFRMVEVFE